MTVLTKHPPLVPTETGERQFYHYRNRTTIVGIVTMSDALAIWRIKHGQDLWPCEWGMRGNTTKETKQ